MSFEAKVRIYPHKDGYHCGMCPLSYERTSIPQTMHCAVFNNAQIDLEEIERGRYTRVRCEACLKAEAEATVSEMETVRQEVSQ